MPIVKYIIIRVSKLGHTQNQFFLAFLNSRRSLKSETGKITVVLSVVSTAFSPLVAILGDCWYTVRRYVNSWQFESYITVTLFFGKKTLQGNDMLIVLTPEYPAAGSLTLCVKLPENNHTPFMQHWLGMHK